MKKYEFNNRITASRKVIQIVNALHWSEPLMGLSSGAIERWEKKNYELLIESNLSEKIRCVARSLFFLGAKSQEQITEEYFSRINEVSNYTLAVCEIVELMRSSKKNILK